MLTLFLALRFWDERQKVVLFPSDSDSPTGSRGAGPGVYPAAQHRWDLSWSERAERQVSSTETRGRTDQQRFRFFAPVMSGEINLRAFGPSTAPSRLAVLYHTPVLTVYDVDSDEEGAGMEIHGDES